ncbi:unnamed protein product [Adineta steineri]|uniref:Uncharacterized protein n=1 Tax=Adineta steineri TaxID=433720 RepID=A0A816CEB0_9BILA|nr:unnamed protein product [Adineta steineri]CAF1621091.1 unnamed protein product [Adineta steineri]
MAMTNNKTLCFTCNKEKITFPCKGCSEEFCLIHFTEHQHILSEELNRIIDDYDQFKQKINEQTQNPLNHLLIKEINQWERDSIEIIQQKAQHCRQIVIEYLSTFFNNIEMKFNDLNEQIKQIHQENEFNEINLSYLTNELIEITEELNNSSKIYIQQDSQSFINDISIILSKSKIFIDENKNIFIADLNNHRIVEWKCNAKEGQIIAGGNKQGNRMDQLNRPTDMIIDPQTHSIIIADYVNRRVIQWMTQDQQILIKNIDCYGLAMDKYGFLYVSDYKKNEVRRWKMGEYDNEGIVVAGGNGIGNQLNQLSYPGFIFVDEDQSVYVSDQNNHRVMKWRKDSEEGIIVAGGNGQGENLNQLSYPQGVIVDDLGQIYIADCWNDRIMRWCEGEEEGEIVVGGNRRGNQLNRPMGLCFDDEENLYVVDYLNHRIQKFEIIL